jgi:hypothetical protein
LDDWRPWIDEVPLVVLHMEMVVVVSREHPLSLFVLVEELVSRDALGEERYVILGRIGEGMAKNDGIAQPVGMLEPSFLAHLVTIVDMEVGMEVIHGPHDPYAGFVDVLLLMIGKGMIGGYSVKLPLALLGKLEIEAFDLILHPWCIEVVPYINYVCFNLISSSCNKRKKIPLSLHPLLLGLLPAKGNIVAEVQISGDYVFHA